MVSNFQLNLKYLSRITYEKSIFVYYNTKPRFFISNIFINRTTYIKKISLSRYFSLIIFSILLQTKNVTPTHSSLPIFQHVDRRLEPKFIQSNELLKCLKYIYKCILQNFYRNSLIKRSLNLKLLVSCILNKTCNIIICLH